eukprot:2043173-Pleurochrysis_carterae.AAC.1
MGRFMPAKNAAMRSRHHASACRRMRNSNMSLATFRESARGAEYYSDADLPLPQSALDAAGVRVPLRAQPLMDTANTCKLNSVPQARDA